MHNLARRIENLEKRSGHKRGLLHIHFEDGRTRCFACEASGPPTAEDEVITIMYKAREDLAQEQDVNTPGTR